MIRSIHDIYGRISPLFRRKRMREFMSRMKPTAEIKILDVGGNPVSWMDVEIDSEITILNLHPIDPTPFARKRRIRTVIGNGCHLDYANRTFDIVFSNSVIEHLGVFERQEQFASELRRVGKALWIQTPARGFFIEPHLLTPFIHFLPRALQRRLVRRFTIWGVVTKPTPEQAEDFLAEIRLLTKREMKQLFPDCEIVHERVLGLTKSFIATRVSSPSEIKAA